MNHKIVNVGGERVLVFDCEKCGGEASLESSPVCMHHALKALAGNRDAQTLLLQGSYVREYRGRALALLAQLAAVLKENERWAFSGLTIEECTKCEEPRRLRLEQVLEETSRDPRKGLQKLRRFRFELLGKLKRGSKRCTACRRGFLEGAVEPLFAALGGCELTGKKDYISLLQPLVRPSFLTTRLKLDIPPSCVLVDSYEVCEAKVRIYRDPERLQHLYFILPPEYHLPTEYMGVLQEVRVRLLKEPPDLDTSILRAKEQVRAKIEDLMAQEVVEKRLRCSREEVKLLAGYLTRFTIGFGMIDLLLSDTKIQDVYVDAPCGETPVHIYHRDFEECETNVYLTADDLEALVSKLRAISGRPFSEASPVLDMNLAGARVALVGPSLSPRGVALAIRRHKPTPWTLPQLVRARFMTPFTAGLLSFLVDARTTLLITGCRGAGKTSLLGALMVEVLPKYRILTIEDTAELPVQHLKKLGFKIQSLQIRSVVSGSGIELGACEALRTALRLGDSVVILGEVRGEEAKILYEAMRIGAAGNSVMGTIHGSSARDVFERVVYDLGISPSSFKATDVILVALPIHLRGRLNRARRLVQVVEVEKGWRSDPVAEGGFRKLMDYDYSSDRLRVCGSLQGSGILKRVARSWATSVEDVVKNLEFRGQICRSLVEMSFENERLLEASFVARSNLVWRGLVEEELEKRRVSYERVLKKWKRWVKHALVSLSDLREG